jgi:hypothetical protein
MYYREPDWELEHKFYAKHDFVWTAKEITPIPGGEEMMEITAEVEGKKTSFQIPKEIFFKMFHLIDPYPARPQVLVDKEWYDALNFVFGNLHRSHTPYSGSIA